MDRVELAKNLKESIGINTINRVFNEMAEIEKKRIQDQTARIVTSSGVISTTGTIAIPANHHHGQ